MDYCTKYIYNRLRVAMGNPAGRSQWAQNSINSEFPPYIKPAPPPPPPLIPPLL